MITFDCQLCALNSNSAGRRVKQFRALLTADHQSITLQLYMCYPYMSFGVLGEMQIRNNSIYFATVVPSLSLQSLAGWRP